jgi:hypothetical protein
MIDQLSSAELNISCGYHVVIFNFQEKPIKVAEISKLCRPNEWPY